MKRLFLHSLKFLDHIVDRILAALGAILLVQFPQFYAAYLQRLGGHLDEAHRVVGQYIRAASVNHLTLNQYINIHLTSNNQVFISTGKLIQNFVERLQHLQASMEALQGASPWGRWWVLLKEMDLSIIRQTLVNFTPGIPMTMEALVYALIGLIFSFGIYQGVKNLIRFLFYKIHPSKTKYTLSETISKEPTMWT
jgi:hypothetical protein